MYRIRFHGRGGQGLKTASRILGTAFFLEGFEVQDAPRYGAERRGAPIFAYVRADREPIKERGIIQQAGLVVVADDSLVALPAANVLQGITDQTVLLIYSNTDAETWKNRLGLNSTIIVVPVELNEPDPMARHYAGAICAAAAAQLCAVISEHSLQQAVHDELHEQGKSVVENNTKHAIAAYNSMQTYHATINPKLSQNELTDLSPHWIEFGFENAQISAPTIHTADNSEAVQTGLWRTMRPIIDYDRCNRCWWVCSTYCPDGAITVTDNNYPKIDYDHCKGCMVCVTQCPPHAIEATIENEVANNKIQEPPQ